MRMAASPTPTCMLLLLGSGGIADSLGALLRLIQLRLVAGRSWWALPLLRGWRGMVCCRRLGRRSLPLLLVLLVLLRLGHVCRWVL